MRLLGPFVLPDPDAERSVPERFPLLEHPQAARVRAYQERWEPLDDSPTLCFDATYATIRDHLDTLSGIHTVVDIGCAFATQQLFFDRWTYVGLSASPPLGWVPDKPSRPIPFFRAPGQRVTTHVATFPTGWDPAWMPDPASTVIISSMALGYGPLPRDPDALITPLRGCAGVYFRGPLHLLARFQAAWPQVTVLTPSVIPTISPLVFLSVG
jgi:hypothetical protein